MPVSFMEAMSSGCVIVCTNLDGMDDLVEDGVSGFIVPQRDPDAIEDRLLRIFRSERTGNEMKRRARDIVIRRDDWSVIAARQ